MCDIFFERRGRILLQDIDLYSKVFSESGSKTSEHNIYERAGKSFDKGDEKTQKQAQIKENGS